MANALVPEFAVSNWAKSRQFVVADPDGYLLRFYEDLGRRNF